MEQRVDTLCRNFRYWADPVGARGDLIFAPRLVIMGSCQPLGAEALRVLSESAWLRALAARFLQIRYGPAELWL
jgi:hypothetical protein